MNHTLTKLFAFLTVIGGLLLSIQASAQEAQAPARQENRLITTIDFASKYVWRGIVLTDGAVLQPSAEGTVAVQGGKVGAGWWGSMDVDDIAGRENEFTEYNWTLSYSTDELLVIGPSPVNLEVGIIHYVFPGSGVDDDCWELFTGASVPVFENDKVAVKAFSRAYYEFDNVNGWYMTAGVSSGVPIHQKWSLVGQGSLAWASANYNRYHFGNKNPEFSKDLWDQTVNPLALRNASRSYLNDATVSLALRGELDQNLLMEFSANYSYLMNSTLRHNADILYGEDRSFWFSWKLSALF